MQQSSEGSFVTQGRQDISVAAIGREEHPGRVRTVGYGVGVRQIFGSAPRSSSSSAPTKDQLAQMREELKRELREELRRDFEQMLESMGISQQHTPMQQDEVLPTPGRVSTKGSCAAEEDDEEDTNTDISYRCKLFVGDPPRLVAIGKVYAAVRRSTQCHLEMILLEWLSKKLDMQMSRCQCPHQRLDLWERHLVLLLFGLHISSRPFIKNMRYIIIISLNVI